MYPLSVGEFSANNNLFNNHCRNWWEIKVVWAATFNFHIQSFKFNYRWSQLISATYSYHVKHSFPIFSLIQPLYWSKPVMRKISWNLWYATNKQHPLGNHQQSINFGQPERQTDTEIVLDFRPNNCGQGVVRMYTRVEVNCECPSINYCPLSDTLTSILTLLMPFDEWFSWLPTVPFACPIVFIFTASSLYVSSIFSCQAITIETKSSSTSSTAPKSFKSTFLEHLKMTRRKWFYSFFHFLRMFALLHRRDEDVVISCLL